MLDSDQMNTPTCPPPVEESSDNSPLAIEAGVDGQSLHTCIEQQVDLAHVMRRHYRVDPVFVKILAQPDAHQCFRVCDGLIWTKNQMGRDIVCLPWKAFLRGRRLVKIVINQAHTMIGHYGQSATSRYIRRYYWWPSMGTDVELFCSSCASFQVMKDSNQKLSGLLHSLPIPDRLWQSISMDFIGPLPVSNGHDYLLVVIYCLMLEVHLIPMMT